MNGNPAFAFSLPILLVVSFFVTDLFLVAIRWSGKRICQRRKISGSEPGWSTFLRGGYLHQFDSDIDSGGDFNTDRLALQGGVSHANDNGRIISLSLGYSTDRYDFSGDRGFAGLRPWDNIHSFRFSAPVRLRYDKHWSVFVMPTIRATAESNADFDEGVTSGGFAGFSYRFSVGGWCRTASSAGTLEDRHAMATRWRDLQPRQKRRPRQRQSWSME